MLFTGFFKEGALMRKLTLAGLAAVAVVFGSAVPASAAASTPSTATAAPTTAISSTAGFGDRISCVSTIACLAVGASTNSAGNSVPDAMVLHGTTWKSVAVKTPGGSTSTELTGVSCKAANYCLVIGDYVNKAGDDLPYVLTWNGSALSAIVKAPMPSGTSLLAMSGVSCVAVKSCAVLASIGSTSAVDGVTQVKWTWNGSAWGRETGPGTSAALDGTFTAAQCFSLTSCVEVGWISPTSSTEDELFDTWNGTSLTAQTMAAPATSGALAMPAELSCSSSANCAVVGYVVSSTTSANPVITGFLQVRSGSTWKTTHWAGAKGSGLGLLLGVSCASAKYCAAVGETGTSSGGVAAASFLWNGTHWAAAGVPGLGTGVSTTLSDANCPSSGHCVAAGQYGMGNSTNGRPLAGYLSGSSWRVVHA